MKDPLHLKATPYDLLEIGRDADRDEIESAFKKGIASGRNVQELTAARKILLDPGERAFADIFLYDARFVRQMVPRIFNDGSQLVTRRMDIARAWENIHRKLFPYMAGTHSLAILWYWWAYYSEENRLARLNDGAFKEKFEMTDAPSADELWRNAISYWVFLMHSRDFWSEWNGARRLENIDSLRGKIERHFINHFHRVSERFQNSGNAPAVARFRNYELLFTIESKTARELQGHDIKINSGERAFAVCCGKSMMQNIGFLDEVLRQLNSTAGDSALKTSREPANQDFKAGQYKKLNLLLSPFAHIYILVEDKKYDQAIHEIKALAPEYAGEQSVVKLLATAYLEKAKQQFSLDLYDDALIFFEKAFTSDGDQAEIKAAIVASCKSKAVSLQKSEPDIAIRILNKGYGLTKDVELGKTLSVILCQRGIDRILKAQEELKKNSKSQNAKKEVEAGVGELRRSAALDPSNSRASEQLKIAEDVLSDIDLVDVYDFMNKNQWDAAVDELELILKNDPKNEKAKKFLEICNGNLCWFCKGKKKRADESTAVKVKMYKVTDRTYNQIRWQTLSLPIPRCERCKAVHETIKNFGIAGGVAGALFGLLGIPTLFPQAAGMVLFAVIAFLFSGVRMGRFIASKKLGRNVKGQETKMEAPVMKQAKAEGWVLGEKPPEARK